ncbi:MAG: hypothetical protein EOQ52_06890 [Mesorhizobium sp.]|nr:MAG: hypothetical protein EOQ52_06890 [Mesorhizobium sp.]
MSSRVNNDRDERARRAADEIMHAEREERAAKTARLREARLAREAQHRTEPDAKPSSTRRRPK